MAVKTVKWRPFCPQPHGKTAQPIKTKLATKMDLNVGKCNHVSNYPRWPPFSKWPPSKIQKIRKKIKKNSEGLLTNRNDLICKFILSTAILGDLCVGIPTQLLLVILIIFPLLLNRYFVPDRIRRPFLRFR